MRPALAPILGPAWRNGLRLRRMLVVEGPAAISGWRARNRDPQQVVRAWPAGQPKLGSDVAVFIHFDPEGRVRPRVRLYLAALREAGLSIVFASNSESLQAADQAALRDLCDAFLLRRNVGYDFGAMREALSFWQLPRSNTHSVLIVNDSVVGPFAPLRPVLDRIDFSVADVWGATDSIQRGYHLQSFFLAVGPAALRHPAWAAFWADVRPARSKEWVIARYEVGLTQRLLKAGLRGRALFSYDALVGNLRSGGDVSAAQARQRAKSELILERGGLLNPSAQLWRELLRAGFPFIKREVLTRNPAGILDIDDWRHEVGAAGEADWLT